MSIIKNYLEEVSKTVTRLADTQSENIERAAQYVLTAIKNNGRFYGFGTGHSHMIIEELYVKAGGLANFKAILQPELMIHELATKSTFIERLEGYSEPLLNLYKPEANDAIIIVSNSGRNAVVVEMAIAAKKKGMNVIAITSLSHSQAVTSRHSSGKKLYEIADVTIDNLAPLGDAGYEVLGAPAPVGPMSDIIGVTIAEAIVVRVVELLIESKIDPEIFISSNVDGADEKNRELFAKYHSYWR